MINVKLSDNLEKRFFENSIIETTLRKENKNQKYESSINCKLIIKGKLKQII